MQYVFHNLDDLWRFVLLCDLYVIPIMIHHDEPVVFLHLQAGDIQYVGIYVCTCVRLFWDVNVPVVCNCVVSYKYL